MSWSAYYVQKGGALVEGRQVATGTGWVNWGAWVLDRHSEYPEAAHLAQEGWQDWDGEPDTLDHELNEMLHAPDLDRNNSAITAQVLSALRARPDNTLSILISDGEMLEERATESLFGDHADTIEVIVENAVRRFLAERGGNLIDKEVTVHRSDGSTFKQHRKVLADAPTADDGEHHQHELSDDDKKSIADGIDKDVAALPEEQRPPAGLVAKAKDVALTAAATAYMWALRAATSKTMGVVTDVLEAVFDTPSDMMKLGYNPNTSSGTSNPQVLDPVKNATGISGHLVASIASKVLVKAAYWIKGKLKGAATEGTEDADGAVHDWAEMISQLFAHLNEQFGIKAGAPDVETVTAAIKKLIG